MDCLAGTAALVLSELCRAYTCPQHLSNPPFSASDQYASGGSWAMRRVEARSTAITGRMARHRARGRLVQEGSDYFMVVLELT